jgi:hypothetical protein
MEDADNAARLDYIRKFCRLSLVRAWILGAVLLGCSGGGAEPERLAPCVRLCALLVNAGCDQPVSPACVDDCSAALKLDPCPSEMVSLAECTADHAFAWCAQGEVRVKDDSDACRPLVLEHAACQSAHAAP